MTVLYNVLEKERAGGALDESERAIHEKGLVAVLRDLHDDLDAAVAARFKYARRKQVHSLLETLEALGQVHRADGDRYTE